MGEVYRARDARLNRDVALKVLPDDLASDPSRRQRFEQEARAVAALKHPNIVAVYDVGENYFVSELVDGESLRAIGPMPARRTIELAAQIADGLAAAHAHGVTHRDLKPENIMVARDGRAKILDFGLAKIAPPAIGADAATQTQAAQTREGVVLGTVGYMSPEQVRGQAADPRSDIFSFGVVVYEMLSGKRAFTGASTIEVLSAILKEDPPELPGSVPLGLKLMVEHCLEKSPDRRFQSARDLGFALQTLSGSGLVSAALVPPPVPRTPGVKLGVIAGVAVLGALGAAFWFGRNLSTRAIPSPTSPVASPSIAAPTPTVAPKPRPATKEPVGTASITPPKQSETPAASEPKEEPEPSPAPSALAAAPVSADAKAAYDEGMRLFNDDKATEAVRHFDDAIRADPDYLEAYVGRAGARRILRQYELSIEDCNKAI
jgi:serine/threonine protein kinase